MSEEFKCSNYANCETWVHQDDFEDYYGMCCECYGQYAPGEIERLKFQLKWVSTRLAKFEKQRYMHPVAQEDGSVVWVKDDEPTAMETACNNAAKCTCKDTNGQTIA